MKRIHFLYAVAALSLMTAAGFKAGYEMGEQEKLTLQAEEAKQLYIMSCTNGEEGEPEGECQARWNKAIERGNK